MKRSLIALQVLVTAAIVAGVAGCGGNSVYRYGAPPERQDISAVQLETMMNDGQPLVLVDVRTPTEFAAGHIPGSVNLPLDDIQTWAQTLAQNTRTCCICASGGRSRTAADILNGKGFSSVYNLLGGMNGWPGDAEPCPVCP